MNISDPARGGLLSLSLILAASACAPAAAPGDAAGPEGASPSAEALLAELNPRGGLALIQAWNGSDPAAVAELYTSDAVVIVSAGEVYRGRDEILSGFLAPLVPTVSELTPTVEQIVGGRETMTLIGSYTARVAPPNAPAYDAMGMFSNTWVRQPDGSWRIRASIAEPPRPVGGTAAAARRTEAGDSVRVVRFSVRPDRSADFERFFHEDLRTAAARQAGVPVGHLDLGTFRLLVPTYPGPHGHLSYYVMIDPIAGRLGSGEVMRDMVRAAFPGAEGEQRVRRWMSSMVLDTPFAPEAGTFVEARLGAER